jgi:autotransporter translocation and assembly factor TamB
MASEREAGTAESTSTPGRGNRLWWGEVVGAALIAVLIVFVLGATVVYVLSGTAWGHERIRRVAQNFLQGQAKGGIVRLGQVSGNLLTGFTVDNFVITDRQNHPFIAVRQMRGEYGIGDLIHKRIWVNNVVLDHALLVLDKSVAKDWNWRVIFPRDTTPKPPSAQNGWTDRLRFTNVRVIEGNIVVRTPWHPSAQLGPAATDSAIQVALSGAGRPLIERVTGGFQKVIELKSVNGFAPLVRLSEPGYTNRLADIGTLRMEAFPFRPPAAEVRDFRGLLPFNDDSVWWRGVTVRLPKTVATGDGSYVFNSGDLTLQAHGNPMVFADMRWVYPRLPADAHGKLDFDLKWRGALEDYKALNMDIADGPARIRGSFGMTRGDSVTIHHTDLRFTDVDTRMVEQLVEGFHSPRRGTLSGEAKVSGGRNALDVDADVAFADQRAGQSRVVAVGQIGFPGHGIRARDLRLRMLPVQVELARSFAPSLPISGTISGTATVNGNTASSLSIVGDVMHDDRGLRSHVAGRAAVQLAGAKRFDVNVRAEPLSLAEAGRFAPAVGLRGVASGPITARGTLANMDVTADLRVSGGGRLNGRAHLGLTGAKRYDVALAMYTLDAHAILERAPASSLSATVAAKGVGTDPATMNASVAADVATSRWDSIGVDSATLRVHVANGLAQISNLMVSGAFTTVAASGSFGLTRQRSGTLAYSAQVDSLASLNRWIPGLRNDTTIVQPRPALMKQAIARARQDSARIARETEIERIVTGKAPPRLQVKMPAAVRNDTVAGRLWASGTLSGNLYDFDLAGRAGGDNVALRGNLVSHFKSEYAWRDARTPASKLILAADADSVMAGGFALDTVSARLTYENSAGAVEVLVRQDRTRDYMMTGDYTLSTARNELRLADLRVRLDTALWVAARPAEIRWGGPGIQVVDLDLRNRGNGRLYANGLLPTKGTANFQLAIENFPIGNLVDLLQSDVPVTGQVNLSGTMTGTLSSPGFRGAFGITQGIYNGTTLPEVHGQFGYANRELVTHVDMLRLDGVTMASGNGRIPINLAFTGVTGSRLLDAPIAVDISGDSLPIDLLPQFTTTLAEARGHVAGSISMRGHLNRPSLTGGLIIANTSLTIASTGMRVENARGSIRMANDVVQVGTADQPIVANAGGGPISLRGTINVGDFRTPSFDLYAYGQHTEILHNQFGKLNADVGLAMKGPYNAPYVSGQVTITSGVVYAPEPTGRHVISAGDPAVFNVIDTTKALEREVLPVKSPMIANMRMEVTVDVNRDVWVRNLEANVEVYSDYPLRVEIANESLNLTGVLATDRGEYKFLGKLFSISRGSAMFIGSPDLNPTLQITGDYQVLEGGGAATDVKVLIGGTLKLPRLSLESDAQPPRSQSELLSLLAFGQATTSLGSAQQTSSIAPSSQALAQGALIAERQLVGVAMGEVVDQAEQSFGRALGTDYFNITTADLPAELLQGNPGSILTTTRFEGGKYLNPRTFLVGQMVGIDVPGARVQYRASEGWRYEATVEKSFLLTEPTLSEQNFVKRQTYGAFVIRQWKY